MDMTITKTKGLRGERALDRDKLFMASRRGACRVAHEALHPIQETTPEELVMGVAVLFTALCRRCGVDPSEAHATAVRMLDLPAEGDRGVDTHIQVLRDFIGARVMGKEVTIG